MARISDVAPTPKAQQTAKRILDVAVVAFFDDGFEDTSISRIADAANVAPGTVLLHHGSKSELATKAFAARIAEAVRVATATPPTGSTIDDVVSVVRNLLAFYEAHLDVAPALLREALFTGGDAGRAYAATVEATVGALAMLVRGEVGDERAFVVAEGLLADYLLVLLRMLRGELRDLTTAVDRFRTLASTRLNP